VQVLKTISTIKTSGSRLLNLVNDILDAASMRKGKLAVKHDEVNLHKNVEDVVELTGLLCACSVCVCLCELCASALQL
jgi:signal transduction histidine kinase